MVVVVVVVVGVGDAARRVRDDAIASGKGASRRRGGIGAHVIWWVLG